MQLFAAAFHRREAASAPGSTTVASDIASAALGWLVPAAQAQSTPCSDVKDRVDEAFGKDAAEVANQGAKEAAGKALDRAVKRALGSEDAKHFNNRLRATGIALKVAKLATFFSSAQLRVEAVPASAHQPPEGSYAAVFVAHAGVDPEALEDALETTGNDRGLRDCLRTLGLPSVDDVRDLAKDSENWMVEWLLVDGSPKYATIPLAQNQFAYPGRLAMRLARVSDAESKARLVVELKRETAGGRGTLRRTQVTALAQLDAASAPGIDVVANAVKGVPGLADNVVELGAGWVQTMAKPKAFGTLELEFHISEDEQDQEAQDRACYDSGARNAVAGC
jgi:hypothetical protein